MDLKVDLSGEWDWGEQALVGVEAAVSIVAVDSWMSMVFDPSLEASRLEASTWLHNFALRQSQLGLNVQMRVEKYPLTLPAFLLPNFGQLVW